MAYGQVNADVIGTSVSGSNLGAGNASIMKNRLINGDMRIDQRNAGASVTQTTSILYTLDRWQCYGTVASKYTVQQNAGSVTPPAGFTNYLGVTSSSAYSVGTGDFFILRQIIEGYNFADLGFGTSNAKNITISFWVRSSLTGTFGGTFQNPAVDRNYPFSYTISSANTWEQKSITIAGDTTGTWPTTNAAGAYLTFGLGAGSTFSGTANAWSATPSVSTTGATSVVGTNGATFYITGVQLEVGSSATGYEYRQYTTELQLCQRYLPAFNAPNSNSFVGQGQMWPNTTTCNVWFQFPVTVRTVPTGITVSSLSHFKGNGVSTDLTSLSAITVDAPSLNGAGLRIVGTGGTASQIMELITLSASAQILLTGCEL